MAQQGGTWRPGQANTNVSSASAKNEKSVVDEKPASSQESKIDGEDWAVINKPDEEPEFHGHGVSSRFNLQVGWGKRKLTVLNWDVSAKKGHTHPTKSTETSHANEAD